MHSLFTHPHVIPNLYVCFQKNAHHQEHFDIFFYSINVSGIQNNIDAQKTPFTFIVSK